MNAACPYALYLGRLTPNSQRSIASQLNSIADMMGWTDEERSDKYHHIHNILLLFYDTCPFQVRNTKK